MGDENGEDEWRWEGHKLGGTSGQAPGVLGWSMVEVVTEAWGDLTALIGLCFSGDVRSIMSVVPVPVETLLGGVRGTPDVLVLPAKTPNSAEGDSQWADIWEKDWGPHEPPSDDLEDVGPDGKDTNPRCCMLLPDILTEASGPDGRLGREEPPAKAAGLIPGITGVLTAGEVKFKDTRLLSCLGVLNSKQFITSYLKKNSTVQENVSKICHKKHRC